MTEHARAQFLEACGATGPLQLNIVEAGTQGTIPRLFHQPFLLIGRSTHADLRLIDPAISLRHAYVQVIGGRVFCFDLRSRTGVRVNGQAESSGWLGRDEFLGVGPYQLQLLDGDQSWINPSLPEPPVNPLRPLPSDQDALPGVSLEITLEGNAKQTTWWMNRVLTLVGSAPECKLRVASADNAKFLCSLLRTPSGLWVIDLLSEQGIRVNGVRVPWAQLADGDQLHVGNVLLRVRYEGHGRKDSALLAPRPSLRARPIPERAVPAMRSPCTGALLLPAGGTEESLVLALADQFAAMQQNMFDQLTQALLMMGQMFGKMQDNQMQLIREELDRLHQVTEDLQGLQTQLLEQHRPLTRNETISPPLVANGARALPPKQPFPRRTSSPGGKNATVLGPANQLPEEEIHAVLCERIATLQQERQSCWQKLFSFLTRRKPGETSSNLE
jgi:hypothetical protein